MRLPIDKKMDFGLRFIKMLVAETLETRKRYDITDERLIMQTTLEDMIKPQLTTEQGIIVDELSEIIFLSKEERKDITDLSPPREELIEQLSTLYRIKQLEPNDYTLEKIQIFDIILSRIRGVAITGKSQVGKSTMINMYVETKTSAMSCDINKVEIYANSLSNDSLYGYKNSSEEWKEG